MMNEISQTTLRNSMSFKDFLGNFFIGQENVIEQLNVLGKEIKSGTNLNVILAAPSGYGKTTLAKAFIKWCSPSYRTTSIIYTGNALNIDGSRRFHILDEAHTISDPEGLYPLMDMKAYVFILLTNEFFKLKEPFYNRCHELIFQNYSTRDLMTICANVFRNKRVIVPEFIINSIVEDFSRKIPRKLVKVTERLAFYFKQTEVPINLTAFKKMAEELLNMKDGFTEFDNNYMKALTTVGGTASITTLSSMTKIPKDTILREVEPFLMGKSLIKITSKGRQLVI